MGFFGISEYYRPIPELDEWLRRRVRMCYWKQWRLCRTKISHLLALGVGERTAIIAGVSSKSYWHLSRSKATAGRDDERLVEGTGTGEYPRPLDAGSRLRMRKSCAPCS